MQCGLPLQRRRVSAWSRYPGGARPLLPSAAHRPPLWWVWWGPWALLFPGQLLTSGQHCICYPARGMLTPGFTCFLWLWDRLWDRTFHVVTQTEGAHPIPPPPSTTLLQCSCNFQLWAPILCLWAFSAQERSDDQPLPRDPVGPCNHGPCSLLPFREEQEASIVTAVARSCCFFTRINIALWFSSPTSYELRCVPQSPSKTCGVLIPVPQEEGMIWK